MKIESKHAVLLAGALATFWLLLSGHYTPLLLGLGAVSVALVVYITLRMDRIDREHHPTLLTPRLIAYWFWLLGEIVRANIYVVRRILHPSLPISPTVIRLKADQRSTVARVTYANSITLTPGTVTISVEGDEFTVHTLARSAAEELARGEMNHRVCKAFGED